MWRAFIKRTFWSLFWYWFNFSKEMVWLIMDFEKPELDMKDLLRKQKLVREGIWMWICLIGGAGVILYWIVFR